MNTVPIKKWPQWVKQQLQGKKCMEVKEHNGNYYLYEYENHWDKKKQANKKTTKYVDVLKQFKQGRALEHGHVRLLYELSNDFISKLKECFPHDWQYLLAFTFNRVIQPMPLKRIGSWYEKTTLSRIISLERVNRKTLANALCRTGENTVGQKVFLESLINDKELLLYDGSLVYSTSKHNRLIEYGYDKHGLKLPQANISLLFSKTRGLPVFFRLYFGSLHEVNVVKSLVDELEGRNVLFVADKGYYKNALFNQLHENGVKFIIPLPRDDSRIQY
jgi:transposase